MTQRVVSSIKIVLPNELYLVPNQYCATTQALDLLQVGGFVGGFVGEFVRERAIMLRNDAGNARRRASTPGARAAVTRRYVTTAARCHLAS